MSISLIDCPACGSSVSSQAAACRHCGQPLRPQAVPVLQTSDGKQKTISCPRCKKNYPADTKWCPECGRRLSAPVPWFIWVLIIGLALQLIGKLMKAGVI